jgi:hypothetical protein
MFGGIRQMILLCVGGVIMAFMAMQSFTSVENSTTTLGIQEVLKSQVMLHRVGTARITSQVWRMNQNEFEADFKKELASSLGLQPEALEVHYSYLIDNSVTDNSSDDMAIRAIKVKAWEIGKEEQISRATCIVTTSKQSQKGVEDNHE